MCHNFSLPATVQAEVESSHARGQPWRGIILVRDRRQAQALQQLLAACPCLQLLNCNHQGRREAVRNCSECLRESAYGNGQLREWQHVLLYAASVQPTAVLAAHGAHL